MTEGEFRPYEERSEEEKRVHDEATLRPAEAEPAALKLSRVALAAAEILNEDQNFSPKSEYEARVEEMHGDALNQNETFDRKIKEGKLIDHITRNAAAHLLTDIALHPENSSFKYIIDESAIKPWSVSYPNSLKMIESKVNSYISEELMQAGENLEIEVTVDSRNDGLYISVELPAK